MEARSSYFLFSYHWISLLFTTKSHKGIVYAHCLQVLSPLFMFLPLQQTNMYKLQDDQWPTCGKSHSWYLDLIILDMSIILDTVHLSRPLQIVSYLLQDIILSGLISSLNGCPYPVFFAKEFPYPSICKDSNGMIPGASFLYLHSFLWPHYSQGFIYHPQIDDPQFTSPCL